MGARKWFIGVFVIAAIAIVFLGVKSFLIKEDREQTKLNSALADALARADSLGVPVYAEHLRSNPIPDDENGWVEINAIHSATYEVQKPIPSMGTLIELESKEQFLQIADEALTFWRAQFPKAEAAAKKPFYRPDRKWEEGVAMLMPDFATVKELVRAIQFQARLDLLENRLDDSINNLQTAAGLAEHVGSERIEWAAIVQLAVEAGIAKEIVVQAGYTDSREHLSRLQDVLETLFKIKANKDQIIGEAVILVESVRMASSDSVAGNELRYSIKPEDRPELLLFWDATPEQTKILETKAIHAACDYYEGLVENHNSAEHNDALHQQFIDLPFTLIPEGFPLSYASLYEALYSSSIGGSGPYSTMARSVAYAAIFNLAFEIASGDLSMLEDVTRVVPGLDDSLLEYAEIEGGYQFTATAPSIKSVTLKFNWP